MPIKGVIFILLVMIIIALALNKEIYAEMKKFFIDKKDEDEEE
jgi:hypothetical protein